MDKRPMGRTGLHVSRICLGTVLYGRTLDEATSIEILHRALEAGINFFDTANIYNEGRSEDILAKALDGRRHEAVIASKLGGYADLPAGGRLSRGRIVQRVEESLRRLDTDYLDIYYAHMFDETTPLEETLEAFDLLVRQGKVRYLGCSNFAGWQLGKALWISDVGGLARFECVQPRYNLLERGIEAELLPICSDAGVSAFPYAPLAGGLLTGQHRGASSPVAGSRLEAIPSYRDSYWNEDNLAYVDTLHEAAKTGGHSLTQLTLAWILNQPSVDSAIVSARTWEQLEECIASVDVELSEREMEACRTGAGRP